MQTERSCPLPNLAPQPGGSGSESRKRRRRRRRPPRVSVHPWLGTCGGQRPSRGSARGKDSLRPWYLRGRRRSWSRANEGDPRRSHPDPSWQGEERPQQTDQHPAKPELPERSSVAYGAAGDSGNYQGREGICCHQHRLTFLSCNRHHVTFYLFGTKGLCLGSPACPWVVALVPEARRSSLEYKHL